VKGCDTIKKYSNAKIILRAHNVEWLIWKRLADACTNPIKKMYLRFLTKRLRSYENQIINSFDGVVALTSEDKKLFIEEGCTTPVYIAPIGVNTAGYDLKEHKNTGDTLSVFHLGSMDWMPNLEAVDWFLKNVLPKVLSKNKYVKLFLAGKSMPQHLLGLQSQHIFVEGEIKDAKNYMNTKDVMIVPLLSGGGMRVKIIEGLALGKIIISTSIGAEGIEYTNGKNILIANTPDEFCTAITKCFDKNFRQAISAEAKLLAQTKYDNAAIGKKLFEYYSSIVTMH
jgi:glycosyltransferase involved in cell wall biosynthesis